MQTTKAAIIGFLVMLEMDPRCHGEGAHVADAGWQTELIAENCHIVTGESYVIQHIGGVESNVEIFPLGDTDGAGGGGIQAEYRGTGDDIASGVAPLADWRSGEGIYVEGVTGGGRIERPDHFRPNLSGDAGAAGGGCQYGSLRRAAGQSEIRTDGPILQDGSFPALEKGCRVQALAAGKLHRGVQPVGLVAGRESAFGFQVEPVLRQHRAALAAAAEHTIVHQFRMRVYEVGAESVVHAAL